MFRRILRLASLRPTPNQTAGTPRNPTPHPPSRAPSYSAINPRLSRTFPPTPPVSSLWPASVYSDLAWLEHDRRMRIYGVTSPGR